MNPRYKSDLQVVKGAREAGWLFGKPHLVSGGLGKADWTKSYALGQYQKGTGWQAELYGGVQSGDDWAACYIPVNELPLTQLESLYWSWYQTNTESMGLGVVIWIHDPTDFDKRAEITQVGGTSGLDKSAGWNSHEFSLSTTQMFFYGENTSGTGLTAGTQYTMAQFQADTIFKNWSIYRISWDWGWEASGTFESAYLAEVKINGMYIEMRPELASHKKDVLTTKTVIGGASTAGDIISENASTGTDWDFDFGGKGYITKAIAVLAAANKTERLRLWLFNAPPASEVDDNKVSDAPVAADVPYLVGYIDFPVMSSQPATAFSVTLASPSTYGNLPLAFDAPILYGILIGLDGVTLTNVLLSIHLFADMED